jgi:hypothetical protein
MNQSSGMIPSDRSMRRAISYVIGCRPAMMASNVAVGISRCCAMVKAQTAFSHHLLKIAQAKIVSQIPAYTQHDHGPVEMATLNITSSLVGSSMPDER